MSGANLVSSLNISNAGIDSLRSSVSVLRLLAAITVPLSTIISRHQDEQLSDPLRSQESLECISFVVFSLHYEMTDGGSRVNILQLHLSPRSQPNGFSSPQPEPPEPESGEGG